MMANAPCAKDLSVLSGIMKTVKDLNLSLFNLKKVKNHYNN